MYDPIVYLSTVTVLDDSIYETFSIVYVDPFANILLVGFTTVAMDNVDNNRSSNTHYLLVFCFSNI